PVGPRLPIQVQRLCNAGTTGTKNEVTASAIASTAAIVSFLANEVTNGRKLGKRLPPDGGRQLRVLFYNVSIHQAGELKHVDFLLTVKNGFQSVIGFDEFFLLKIVLLNVFPEFFR